MKLKVKNLPWLAGRPVVFLNQKAAQKINVHVDERVCLDSKKKIFSVVDIFDNVVKDNEIGISHEVSRVLSKPDNSIIEVSAAEVSYAARLIKKKLSGEKLSREEIRTLVKEIVRNNLTESEIAYFAAAEKSEGMSMKEIIYLTEAMISSGNQIRFNKKIVADKHCLPFETPIFARENNKNFFTTIGDLVEKNLISQDKNLNVLSWDDDYNVRFVKIKDYFKIKSPKMLHKITLRGNRSITLTEDHSIFILRKGKILNLPSKDIKKGDYVLVPRGMNDKLIPDKISLAFKDILKKNGKITKDIQFSNELMRFLGYYVSEGSKNYQGIFLNFGSHELDLIEDAKKCISHIFGIEPTVTRPHKTAVRLCIYSKELSNTFSIFGCGNCALDKTIPDFIFNIDKAYQLEFLKALFDGDGYTRRGYEASYVTVSKNLANQLCYLLSFLGMSSSISISKECIKNFPTGEHFCSEAYYIYTQAREIYGGRERSNVSFINLLPINEIGEMDKKQIGWVKRRALKNQKYITFEKLKEIKEVIQSKEVKMLIDSNLAVLEVKNNELVNSSSEFVYDIKTSNGRFIAGFMPVCIHNCIGGIAGNRTTPIGVSICAAAGLTLPKTSSRAITSASGTADVIETISNVELSAAELKKIVEKTNACLAWGGSLGLAPSDDKIIHVERLLNLDVEPQLLASIMSKKISAGSNYILIDIPFGPGAKFNTKKQARSLANKFKRLAGHFGVKLKIVYTQGREPIGNGIGPVLEMFDVLSVLKNEPNAPQDLKNKALFLSSELMTLCGIKNSKKLAKEILESGRAYEKFKEIINAQNKSNNFDKKVAALRLAKIDHVIYAEKSGKIYQIDNKKINSLCRILGTPETQGAGIYLHKHIGDVKKGEPLVTLYSESKNKIEDALKFFKESTPILIR